MTNKIIIFIFENILINKRMKIPKQTYHLLQKLKKNGYIIGIISNNPLIYFDARELGLYKYSNYIKCDNKLQIYELFNIILNNLSKYKKNNYKDDDKIYFIDTDINNLQKIKKNNDKIFTIHCKDIYKLYNIIDKNNLSENIENNIKKYDVFNFLYKL